MNEQRSKAAALAANAEGCRAGDYLGLILIWKSQLRAPTRPKQQLSRALGFPND
jgi:hypothetical protein